MVNVLSTDDDDDGGDVVSSILGLNEDESETFRPTEKAGQNHRR